MSGRQFSTLVLGILLLCTAAVFAQVQQIPPSISVSGQADVRVIPDEVVLTLGVQTADKVLKTAKAANDKIIKEATAVCRRHGVEPQHIQTDYLQIEPHYRDEEVTGQLLGYVVRRSIVVRLKNISQFEGLLSDVLDAGVNHVHGIDFRTAEMRKYRDQARTLAIKAAKEKADALATDAGRTVGKVLTISEGGQGWWSGYGAWWGSRGGYMSQNVIQNSGPGPSPESGNLAPGQISVSASVSMTFALE
jgi:uncharacterized protein YggE